MPDRPNVKQNPKGVELNATAASLLGFLLAGSQSGYDLAGRIESSLGNFWNVTRSQIYRELRALEEAGLVRVGVAGVRERRAYALTSGGRRSFTEWISAEPAPENIRFPLLLTLFFGDQLAGKELARILRAHRARHEAVLAAYRAQLPAVEPKHPFPARTLRFGLMYEEMVLRWFATLADEGLM